MKLRVSVFCAVVLLSASVARPVLAQSAFQKAETQPIVGQNPKGRAAPSTQPPGLPGTALGGDRVTPADKSVLDLPPTEALFDAIIRGDINSARDAVNRGADITARNVLGLTPVDESVDLGRNDITFLLLSLRPAGSPEPARTAKAPGKPSVVAAKVAAPQPAPAPRPVAAARPALVPVPRQQAETRVPSTPGTPNPQAGFLGFGG